MDTTDLLDTLGTFAADPNGSIDVLLSRLLSLRRTLSGMGDVHGVVKHVHTPCSSPAGSKQTTELKANK